MVKKGWMAVFLLFLPLTAASLTINEVMYDPGQCSDSICEWIELYNSGETEVNLTGCLLEGKALSGIISAGGFAVAVRKEQNFTQFFGNVDNLQELSFNLGNNGDTVQLAGRGDCNQTFNYTYLISFADGNNKTLERNFEQEWGESKVAGGTPG
ncbi:MAG TPA: lamin tail domain-containing protein, partial [Candidatus Nanoarchaeia archaeon]|nr:lamin tail domain-containing protein [Candidatus Nanoarchaeia archaeon]